MRSIVLGSVATLALAALATGQTSAPATPQAPAASRLEQVKAAKKEFEQAQQEFYKKYSELKTQEERSALLAAGQPKPESFAPKLWALVDADPKDDAAGEALSWIATTVSGNDQAKALKILTEHHAKAEGIGTVCLTLADMGKPEDEGFIRRVLEENPHEAAQGKACFALAKVLKRSAFRPQPGKPHGDEDACEEATELFQRCIDEFEEVGLYGDAVGGNSLAEWAKGELFEMKNLGIGKAAPDIEGKDADGVPFRLSDYRGKVVVLDFWGYW